MPKVVDIPWRNPAVDDLATTANIPGPGIKAKITNDENRVNDDSRVIIYKLIDEV
jgi:hypothetical protein